MSNINVNKIKINKHKNISELTIDFQSEIICIFGENGVGKTNLLESLAMNFHQNKKSITDRNIEFTLSINLKDYSSISSILNVDLITVTCLIENDRYSSDILAIEGIDEFTQSIQDKLDEKEMEFRSKIKDYLNMLEEFKKLRDKIYSSEYYYPKFHNDFFDFNNSKKEVVSELITGLEGFLNQNNNFLINKKDLTFPQFDYWFRHNIYSFNDTYISEDRYQEFKDRFKESTLELNGLEIDFESIDKKVTQVNNDYNDIIRIINTYTNRYKSTYTETTRDTIHDILSEVTYIRNELKKIINKYLNQIKYIPNYLDKYANRPDKIEEEEYETILSIIGADIALNTDPRNLSDGEKWIQIFVGNLSNAKNCLILVDEPGIYLNPALQTNIIKVFNYLTMNGCQIIYTTHSHFLLDFHLTTSNMMMVNSKKPRLEILEVGENYSIDNVQMGEILMLSTKQIVLVEGICDELLFENVMKYNLNMKNPNVYFYQCDGDGILPVIDFCITANIDFKSIIDNDKYDKLIKLIGKDRYERNKNRIYFVGEKTQKNKLEDLLTKSDEKLLSRPSKTKWHDGELHINRDKLVKVFKEGNQNLLSDKLVRNIKEVLIKLQII